ncbi:MAG: aminoacyl-tRNA hydrolase [Alphaproteobacteria bacterium]|nr:aminoacyl-tRNA hydrolase [Alphaproteobacteria bacterium]|tara:strand:- start:266 stop:838 length:573 start_codon:yes stop_codon:yes gene_type:complete
MWLIIGLGNPGQKYEKNRHNIGFMAVDTLAYDYSFSPWKKKFQGQISEGQIDGEKVLLLKPETYMNESGRSAQEATKFYKVPPENICVIHDELDLERSKLRVKKGGGTGGHNGLKSLDRCLPNKDYWRVRMGIGHPGHKDRVHGYVLSDFAKAEREGWLEKILAVQSDHFGLILNGNHERFMSNVALDMK